jgi:hypothetical protein
LSPGEAFLYNGLDNAGKVMFLEILKKREEASEEARDEAREEGRKEERKRGVCLLYIYYRGFTMLCMLC